MSTSRVHRLLRLISLLQSGRTFTADQLAEELNVSRRTLFRDLNMLDLAGVPYHYDAKLRTYRIDQSFFLPSLNLTLEEALAILLVTRRFISRQSLPTYDPATRAAVKIESGLPSAVQEYCGRMLDGVKVQMPPLVDASRVEQVFGQIHAALGEQRKLDIEYESYFEHDVVKSTVHPYRLLFVSRAWYLVAYSEVHKEVRTFKLDRIIKVNPRQQLFEPDPEFDLDKYFGLAWSIIPEGQVYHVKLRFLPKVAGNVEEISWHKTQQFTAQPDGSCLFEADVDGLGEITWWILGYGDQVIVEEPPELRERVRQIAEHMVQLAESGQPAPGASGA